MKPMLKETRPVLDSLYTRYASSGSRKKRKSPPL